MGIDLLIVEDDPDNRELLAEILSAEGLNVATADDGSTGLSSFRALSPKVVLTDEALPKLKGTQMAAQIKAASPDTKIILTTGYGDSSGTQACDRVLGKPVDPGILVATVFGFLGR